jgi:hypothetical protein
MKKSLLDTWATTVEIMFALKIYKEDSNQLDYSYRNSTNYQNLMISDEIHYTSGGYDMIDTINQRDDPNFGNQSQAYPIDRVSGYTLKELEGALDGARSWYQWRDNIKNKYTNPPKFT